MDELRRIAVILARLGNLEARQRRIEDRVGILEDNTCSHESRLEDLEQWQEQVEDKQDKG